MKPAPILASLVLLAILLGLFSPALFQGKILAPLDIQSTLLAPWSESAEGSKPHNQSTADAVTQYLPYRLFIEESLRKDGYIGWNPYEMGGYNMAANTMALPGTWTMHLHRFLSFQHAWNLGILAEFLIAGFGMLAFLRSRRLGWLPCLIGAVAFTLNAQFIIWIHHRWALSSFCWMPLLLWSAADWKGLPDLSLRRCLLPFWIALALMGATLQHMAFVFLTCSCLFLSALPSLKITGWHTISHLTKLTASWALAWLLAVGMAAFTIVPQIQGYLVNIEIGHVRGGIGYAEGPSQILYHILLIPARIWPWLMGDPQSLDAFRLLKSDYMSLNYIGTIPMLLSFVGLFIPAMPRAAKWLIATGLLIPLSPLVGPLYHRVELLFILGACWITAELLHHLSQRNGCSPLQNAEGTPDSSTINPQTPPSSLVSCILPTCFPWKRLLITAVTAIGLALLTGTLLPSSIRNQIESTVVSKTLQQSSKSVYKDNKDWFSARAIEWTSRFSLLHPKTAWAYGLLLLGTTGLLLSTSSLPLKSANGTLANSSSSATTHAPRGTPYFYRRSRLSDHSALLLILTATTLELTTIFHGWCTFTDPALLTPSHPAIESIRTQAGPHRVLQRSPDAGFTDTFATPNLLAAHFVTSIDAYESIQYPSPQTVLADIDPALRLQLAGVAVAIHPNDKPFQTGTEAWHSRALGSSHSVRISPYTPPPIAIGHGEAPIPPTAILHSLTNATPITPTTQSPNRLTLSLPQTPLVSPEHDEDENPKHRAEGATWLRLLRNWHPGWKWRSSGSSSWLPFRNGPDAACWIDHLPSNTKSIEVQFFPRPLWLTLLSLSTAMAWLGAALFRCFSKSVYPTVGRIWPSPP